MPEAVSTYRRDGRARAGITLSSRPRAPAGRTAGCGSSRLEPGGERRARHGARGAGRASALRLCGRRDGRAGGSCSRDAASVFARVSDWAYVPLDAEVRITSGTAAGARARVGARGAALRPRLRRGGGRAGRDPRCRSGDAPGRPTSCRRRRSTGADRLICVEVLTPDGNWSSYPPHKHDDTPDQPREQRGDLLLPRRPGGRRRDERRGLRPPPHVYGRRLHRRDDRRPRRRRVPRPTRLPRPLRGRARVSPLLPQRDGRPEPRPDDGDRRRSGARLDPRHLGRRWSPTRVARWRPRRARAHEASRRHRARGLRLDGPGAQPLLPPHPDAVSRPRRRAGARRLQRQLAARRDEAVSAFGFREAVDDWRRVCRAPRASTRRRRRAEHAPRRDRRGRLRGREARVLREARRGDARADDARGCRCPLGRGDHGGWLQLPLRAARPLRGVADPTKAGSARSRTTAAASSPCTGAIRSACSAGASSRTRRATASRPTCSATPSTSPTCSSGPLSESSAPSETFVRERPLPRPGEGTHYGRGAPGDPTGAVTNEDYAAALVVFESGARGTFEASRTLVGPESQMAFDVYGTGGARSVEPRAT